MQPVGNWSGSYSIEGWLALIIYHVLYRFYHMVVHGPLRMPLFVIMDLRIHQIKPKMKAH